MAEDTTMMKASEQQLFLAEFLVDKVNVPSVRAVYADMIPATTCVSFQILNLPPLNIYQEAPSENCNCSTDGEAQLFRKGKSCLFALPAIVLEKPLNSFPITMSVYKKLPPGVLPDVMLIGAHTIETKDLVNALLSQHLFKSGNPCKSMKEAFKIKTATGQHVGEVTVFIRISCCGRKIVTQFQIPQNEKPYLFKGADDSPIFQCKRIPSDMMIDDERQEVTSKKDKCKCESTTSKLNRTVDQAKSRTCCSKINPPPCPPPSRQGPPTKIESSRTCCSYPKSSNYY